MSVSFGGYENFVRISLVAMLAASSQISFAAAFGTVCQNCTESQRESCALETALSMNLLHNDQVWVLDLAALDASAFRVLGSGGGNIPHAPPSLGKKPPLLKAAHDVEPVPFSTQQWEFVSGGMLFVRDIVLPAGGQIFQSCVVTNQGGVVIESFRGGASPDSVLAQTNAPFNIPVNVPGNMHGSGYDIIGNRSAGVAIGNWWKSRNPAAGQLYKALILGNNFLNIPFNTNVILVLHFEDGSRGLLVPNAALNEWEPDFDNFFDSDNNQIPAHPGHLVPGTSVDFSGQAPGPNNVHRYLQRAAMMGIPITGPSGDRWPVRCEVTSEGLRCYYELN